MAYAAAPVAAPAAPVAFEEGKAPPTIDSHGGKLSPMTCCWGCGPDGATSLLLLLALLSTLAPRRLKGFGRDIDLSALRLAPGLLLTAVIAWNLVSRSFDPQPPFSVRFELVGPISTALNVALLAIGFLHLLSDALMPVGRPSPARALAAMAAADLGVLALPVVAGIDVEVLMNDGALAFNRTVVLGAYLGLPAGLAVLLAWRRFDGRPFDILLIVGTIGLLFLGGSLLPNGLTLAFTALTVALTTAASLGAGLRGLGSSAWQGLTGRAAWALSWILRVLTVMAVGMWVLF